MSLARGCNVSIHAPARGATRPACGIEQRRRGFNPRPRAGGDDAPGRWRRAGRMFQSTPPRGGRPPARTAPALTRWFQSTPPRGGRRAACRHARHRAAQVSIHAPARGATTPQAASLHVWRSFNPRPRAGGDSTVGLHQRDLDHVSIHAPARGATMSAMHGHVEAWSVSIHAPARGATRAVAGRRSQCCWFQSTPPRGGRRTASEWTVPASRRFNPRPRAGGDKVDALASIAAIAVSIHAPARGATIAWAEQAAWCNGFQSTPPRGGRHCQTPRLSAASSVSIHAPARGATTGSGSATPELHDVSIHAPARGATRRCRCIWRA